MRGKLKFFYGCMGSGKSLQLLASAYNFQERGIPYVIFKSNIDTRDGEGVIHSRALGDKSCTSISPELDIFELVSKVCQKDDMFFRPRVKWILVDEAQFLTPEQVDQLAAVADVLGINIMCFGLRTDFQTHLFPGSKRLFEVADDIIEIKSSCSCDTKTMFNARIDSEGNVVTEGNQVEVGGDDRYVALCRKCYYERTKNKMYRKFYEDES
jgi:thymidine kinase